MMGYYGGWGMMGPLGMLAMLVFWTALVILVLWAVRTALPGTRRDERDAAHWILLRRFAAGEINQAEYEQARRALGLDDADAYGMPRRDQNAGVRP